MDPVVESLRRMKKKKKHCQDTMAASFFIKNTAHMFFNWVILLTFQGPSEKPCAHGKGRKGKAQTQVIRMFSEYHDTEWWSL